MQNFQKFNLVSPYSPAGDQGKVIEEISGSILEGNKEQTILGVTGSGKTYIMASIVNKLQRPTLVIAHNKTLAAQLAEEFSRFFPDNSVQYFVSYYDYYQPESYLPSSDTYIEKQTEINEEIEKLRNAAMQALLTRKDVLIVASVSCIYGLGDPEDFGDLALKMEIGGSYPLDKTARKLVAMQYVRTPMTLSRGQFRIQGEVLEIVPASEDIGYRFSFFGDELEIIERFNPLTGDVIDTLDSYSIFPANPFVTSHNKVKEALPRIEKEMLERVSEFEKEGKFLEAQRLTERVQNDLEMLETTGFVSGIENYSSILDGREDGDAPSTLLDYFPEDSLCFIDESHITLSQIGAMYAGDRSRKETLVNYGFRLPSALNNRPLKLPEFYSEFNNFTFVSATPGEFERGGNGEKLRLDVPKRDVLVSEAIIRPTGLLDPEIVVKPVKNQVDDVLEQVRKRVLKGQRVLITTLTKKFAEELDVYFKQIGVKSAYIHSDVDTLERLDIIADLRRGKYDVLIGINLLREGLDLPEVSLVAIFDADKEGFLRSKTSLVQIVGRAARHEEGQVVMYADKITESMRYAIDETERRRNIQMEYNQKHGIVPKSTKRELKTIADEVREEDDSVVDDEVELDELEVESQYGRRGRYKDKKGKKVENRVVFNQGKQVYADFESQKALETRVLKSQNLSKVGLKKELEKAVEEMNFERAAAARDLLDES